MTKSCIFLGYISGYKGYQCFDPTLQNVHISRHVVFDKDSYPRLVQPSSLVPTQDLASTPSQVIFFPFSSTILATNPCTSTFPPASVPNVPPSLQISHNSNLGDALPQIVPSLNFSPEPPSSSPSPLITTFTSSFPKDLMFPSIPPPPHMLCKPDPKQEHLVENNF